MKLLLPCLLLLCLTCVGATNAPIVIPAIPAIKDVDPEDATKIFWKAYIDTQRAIAATNVSPIFYTNICPLVWTYPTTTNNCFVAILQTIDMTNYQFVCKLPYGATNFTTISTRPINFYTIVMASSLPNSVNLATNH